MSIVRADDEYIELVRHFPLIPIRDDTQFEDAIKVMKGLAYRHAALTRAESDYLAVLGDLIAQYEKRLPRLTPDLTPVEALRYLMEINTLTQADLVPIVGHKSNLSAFLSGKRGLSKLNTMRLAERFKVSPSIFLSKDQ